MIIGPNSIHLPAGRYVVAVSGGVDSMSLLDMLSKQSGLELIVAHFNHGIRQNAADDEKLVARTAKKLGLKFEVGHGGLGARASEEKARKARYDFLEKVRVNNKAKFIVTAHHQDDLIETAVINVLRGTGRLGLSAIKHNELIKRPLINTPKKQILAYAKANKIKWLEDSTNKDTRFLRNYIRAEVAPKLGEREREKLLKNIERVAKNKQELEYLVATMSQNILSNGQVDRSKFTALPLALANELVSYWLRSLSVRQFDRKTIQRLVTAIKTAHPNTETDVNNNLKLVILAENAHFSNR